MFSDGRRPAPEPVRPGDFVGTYALYDDGWPRRLRIASTPDGELQAAVHSYRAGVPPDYAASIRVGETAPHQVTLVVRDFNELPEQVFHGWFFTRTRNGFAGVTDWKGKPYGFFARRSRPLAICPPAERGPSLADVVGSHTLYCDGVRATVHLDPAGSSAVTGELSESGSDRTFGVTGEFQVGDASRLTLAIDGVPGTDEPVTFDGYVFSRPRNVVAGELHWDGATFGCYLARFG